MLLIVVIKAINCLQRSAIIGLIEILSYLMELSASPTYPLLFAMEDRLICFCRTLPKNVAEALLHILGTKISQYRFSSILMTRCDLMAIISRYSGEQVWRLVVGKAN